MNGAPVTSLSLATGGLLKAATSDGAPDDRVRSGLLVPWGEPGRTNLGLKKVHRGAISLTADAKVVGIYGHNREAAVSRVVLLEDRPEGLWGRIKVARTPLGDQLLAEIDDGARDALSIEFSDLEFDAAGDVTAARLDFVAHVPVGAYDSARIDLAATVNDTQGDTSVTQPDTLAAAPADEMAALRAEMAELRASLPTAASQLSTAGLPTAAPSSSKLEKLATLQAAVATEGATPEMRAALADITNSELSLFHRPAGIGEELWSGGGYTRRFVPLFTQKELTSWKFGGWRWVQGPVVGDYAGDKTEIPTNEVSVEPVEGTARRVAGGWDIDRKFRDFGDTAFWTGFYAAQAESYAEKTDQIAAAALVAAARNITTDANVPAGYTNVNVAQAIILHATALGQVILEDTPNVRRPADFVIMNPQDFLSLLEVAQLDAPAFLNLFGVAPGSFLRSPLVPAGSIIMGVRPAISFYELGGGAPIRVEALDVARAGVDSAVYGYCGTLVNRPGGVISVPLVPAG
jgi:HK97 family phage prohead protease